ncbi:DUF1631 domain-containing protein [Dokdonella sp.]|uniref:DUF1631 domain-containing protein n=1 Tax=Dokdonella sp. TaxID=2291710 RepID=UPI0025C0D992|nr:DUF1631 domain-containing protein [Dokdonella sp.]MBX3692035.1 DUF1631 domain-containing protein [Dokdonella sp.]MCW5567008.1 DUF1631 domain-containing protein [Dokdonella sp.]
MSNPDDKPGRIFDFPQRHGLAASGDRLGELLKLVRGIALKRVNGLVNSLFENVDDALFHLAERAESNAVQVQFFDGMREVRKKRQLVERIFQEQLSKIFSDFADGKLKPVKPELAPQSSSGLSLVDDVELEESLAISSMAAKAENRLSRTLFAVNQRLSVINGGAPVEDSSNPLGPAPLCNAFRQAVREFDLNVQVKLIIYKLFDRYVMSGLESLYDEVNAELIQAGVLPQIRHRVAPLRGSQPMGASDPPQPPAPGEMQEPGAGTPASTYSNNPTYDPAAAELQAELYNQLRSLLAARRPQQMEYASDTAEFGGRGTTPMVPNLSPTDLLSALTILQSQTLAAQSQVNSIADATQAVTQIKQELLDQVGKLGGEAHGHHVSTADEDTIDLVGMLFEYILKDRNLPSEIQAQIGRLQIPYLKIAILDKHLFAQKSHPARRLLDAVAEAGKSWTEESDPDHKLFNRIKSVIETVLTDFDDDLAVIEHEYASFDQFIHQHRKRAELAEQRAAEVTRGREKLHTARRNAAREILARIGDRELPAVVHDVLSRPWANYLVLTELRHGTSSDEWKNALRFADEFVWSALPKQSDAERARLRSLLPHIEKALRHGLGTVAYHEGDVRLLMQQLSQFYQRVINGEALELTTAEEVIASHAEETDANAVDAGGAAVTKQSPVEEIVLSSGSLEPETVEVDEDDEYVRTAKELKVGTWVEFTDESGNRERAKLSWISPISSKYLFVNRRGLKVCDKSVAALAVELRRGSTLVLEEVPLFDRALDAIVERLRQTQPPSVEPPPAGTG